MADPLDDAIEQVAGVVAEAIAAEREAKLAVFRDLNEQAKEQGFRIPWSKRLPIIHEQFPTIRHLDWTRVFVEEPDIWMAILETMVAESQKQPGRDGPRPKPSRDGGEEELRRLMGQDYSMVPFDETFKVLSVGLSITQIARKTSIARTIVHRLLRGEEEPKVEEMESVAKAFGKHPSFFIEYRTAFITAIVHQRMAGSPETTVALYRKVTRRE